MSHEADEARPNPSTGATGPEASEASWPGPWGLGGPGSEELPVPKGSVEREEPAGNWTDGPAEPGPGGEDKPGEATGPGEAAGPGQTIETEQTIRAGQAIEETVGTGPAGNGDNVANGEVVRERDEYLDALLRLQAEFDNYRKRAQRQQRETVENAAATLVKKLLPVLDTADLALAHGGGEDVKQVAGALFDILSKEGLERIDPEGQPFDPVHHDAVAHEPVEGQGAPETPEVSEVMRAGYMWKGQVLRPAMVKVRG
jgi:molecular chaperone GrpE